MEVKKKFQSAGIEIAGIRKKNNPAKIIVEKPVAFCAVIRVAGLKTAHSAA
jgi:hypothetical protein